MTQALKENKTFSDFMRATFKGLIDPVASFFNRIGVHPNTITLLGLVGHFGGAALIATGYVTWGGIVILVMAPFDVLDGAMARLRGQPTPFGAFFDSVIDRYSEFVLFGGLLIYYIQRQDFMACIVLFVAAAGSAMVPYIRSRAESQGFEAKNGLLSRLERYIVLIPALIFNIPIVALWILAVLANFTAIQRILHVRGQALKAQKSQDV